MEAAGPPRATYRLQFHANFTFDDAAAIAPYLAALGVSHVYASPIQKARAGSLHGYDIIDHSQINPELGGEDGFRRLSQALRDNGLQLLLDIVPNHMGVGGADNRWWLSVLEWGEQSPFARMFDIDWERTGANRKLMLPFLGQPYGASLRAGDLQLRFDEEEGSFSVWSYEHRFPINPLDYRWILEWAQVAGGGGLAMRPLYLIAAELRELSEAPRPATQEGRIERCERIKRDLAAHARSSHSIRDAIAKAVAFACGDPRTPESFGALHRVLDQQSYRLAYWRIASSETNYRRFFDINSLAGLRVEDPLVREMTHKLLFDLVAEGRVHGFRIDHIDGLAYPGQYLADLRKRVGEQFYIVVEKIVEPGERLPDWPIAGTTGYEALTLLDAVFVSRDCEAEFSKLHAAICGQPAPFAVQLRDTKLELLRASFASELETLVSDLKRAADGDLVTSDFTADALRRAASEVIAALPVYRTYIDRGHVQEPDKELINRAVDAASADTLLDTRAAHDLIASFLLAPADGQRSPSRQRLLDRIVRRFQQLSGPVMAKSLEDTLFYRDARFVARNEVGGDLSQFGVHPDLFHAFCEERAERWPHALTATATHDTKRGEDVRARLAALSHAPAAWRRIVEAAERVARDPPDANDRYMLLQTLLGAWPVSYPDGYPERLNVTDRERFSAYVVKSVRESKRRSSWTALEENYEAATLAWLDALTRSDLWHATLTRELPRIARAGASVTFARTALKFVIPGVPDIYQGCEFEDFSLVDPDNRRPVDYRTRLASLNNASTTASHMKQSIIKTLLQDRATTPLLYACAGYEALASPEPHLVCFSRSHESESLIAAVCTDPFARFDPERIIATLTTDNRWSNLLERHALEQREHGGPALPALVLRKSH